MNPTIRFMGAAVLLAVCALHPIRGHACSNTSPDVFSVGNKVADPSCNYGTIQAAISAATCPAGTKIILNSSGDNSSGDYTNQHLTITNQNISLIGRANTPKCNTLQGACGIHFPCPQAPLRTIEGNIKIRGSSNVTIQYLDITNGHGAADDNGHTWGGGIDYAATGSLNLFVSTVEYNTANDGGGIRFQGYGGAADLYLHGHTQISHNTATSGGSGGGIRLEGQATLHADEANTWIHDNVASDKGGGIIVIAPSKAHIGSSGDVFFGAPVGVVYHNTANYGGGIAAFAQSVDAATVDIYATDPSHPVRIEHNLAYQTGGGMYVGAYNSGGNGGGGDVNMGGAQIDDNAAQEGSAIYADTDSSFLGTTGGDVWFKTGYCGAGIVCNSVSNNRAVATDSSGNETPTAGSAVLLQTEAYLEAQQIAMRGNQGAHVIRVVDSLSLPLILDTCLLAGNTTTAELITSGNAAAEVSQCTFANNSIGGAGVIRSNGDVTLTNSIFAQGSFTTLMETNSGAAKNLDYLLSMEVTSLNGGTHLIQGDAGFVDPGNGNFHLNVDSPGVDVAPPVPGDDRDLDNLPRDQDLTSAPNLNGDRDLGAYERQFDCAADTIFCNGFE